MLRSHCSRRFATQLLNEAARFAPGDPARQELIVLRVRVSHMGTQRRVRLHPRRGPSRQPIGRFDLSVSGTRVQQSRVARRPDTRETARPPAARTRSTVPCIESFLMLFGRTLPSQLSGLGIREALLFRPCEGSFLYQQALPLIPLPRTDGNWTTTARSVEYRLARRVSAASPRSRNTR